MLSSQRQRSQQNKEKAAPRGGFFFYNYVLKQYRKELETEMPIHIIALVFAGGVVIGFTVAVLEHIQRRREMKPEIMSVLRNHVAPMTSKYLKVRIGSSRFQSLAAQGELSRKQRDAGSKPFEPRLMVVKDALQVLRREGLVFTTTQVSQEGFELWFPNRVRG
ncbi:MAG: hypothetical protein JWM39_760 [Parcubacteria group bacterium]|nr:hypothetical protein [Parcubacteria group bacterium]